MNSFLSQTQFQALKATAKTVLQESESNYGHARVEILILPVSKSGERHELLAFTEFCGDLCECYERQIFDSYTDAVKHAAKLLACEVV